MTAIWKHSKWVDGAGIEPGDLNNISNYLRSQTHDLFSALARSSEASMGFPTGSLFCVGNGGAPWFLAANAMHVKFAAGPIGQLITAGTPTGDVPAVNWYWHEANELEQAIDAADPTNPRIDLVCVKIDTVDDATVVRNFKDAMSGAQTTENVVVRTLTRLQKQYVKGTAAGSPVEGAVPSGYVKLMAVRVPAAATALSPDNFTDYRWPLGLHIIDVTAFAAACDATKWVWPNSPVFYRSLTLPNAAGDPLLFVPQAPLADTGRLIKVGLKAAYRSSGTTGRANRLRRLGVLGSEVTIEDLAGLRATIDNNGYYFEATPAAPCWLNGWKAGYAKAMGVAPNTAPPIAEANGPTKLALEVLGATNGTGNDIVYHARFFIAASCG